MRKRGMLTRKSFTKRMCAAISLIVLGVAGCATVSQPELEAKIRQAQDLEAKGHDAEAMRLYEDLAGDGDASAMISVGLKYHRGEGVEQDYGKAMDWYLRAYRLKEGDAYNNIGVMYRDGLGIERNRRIAYLLFLATHMAGLGSEQTQLRAGSNLSGLAEEMEEEEIKEALCCTWAYVDQYVKSRGKKTEVTKAVLPTRSRPRIKDNSWWLPGEREYLTYDCSAPWD